MKSLILWPWEEKSMKSFFNEPFFSGSDFFVPAFPKLDIEDKKDSIVIKADIPGVDQKDINIEAQEDCLVIQGKTEESKEEKSKNYYRQERKSGSFYREIPLPCAVDSKAVTASFKNGVLEVHLPKIDTKNEKRVKVQIQ